MYGIPARARLRKLNPQDVPWPENMDHSGAKRQWDDGTRNAGNRCLGASI